MSSADTNPRRGAALNRLNSTIVDLHRSGETVPCTDPHNGHLWLSDDRPAIAQAVHGCSTCPALDDCRAYVTKYPEPAGVWAGIRPAATGQSSTRRRRAANPVRQPRSDRTDEQR